MIVLKFSVFEIKNTVEEVQHWDVTVFPALSVCLVPHVKALLDQRGRQNCPAKVGEKTRARIHKHSQSHQRAPHLAEKFLPRNLIVRVIQQVSDSTQSEGVGGALVRRGG